MSPGSCTEGKRPNAAGQDPGGEKREQWFAGPSRSSRSDTGHGTSRVSGT